MIQTTMIVETPNPLANHFLWLSEKAPFATGHRAIITDKETGDVIRPRSVKLNRDNNVVILNRKKAKVDRFAVTYNHSAFYGHNVIVKHLGCN